MFYTMSQHSLTLAWLISRPSQHNLAHFCSINVIYNTEDSFDAKYMCVKNIYPIHCTNNNTCTCTVVVVHAVQSYFMYTYI